jgi:hypothetical protein
MANITPELQKNLIYWDIRYRLWEGLLVVLKFMELITLHRAVFSPNQFEAGENAWSL